LSSADKGEDGDLLFSAKKFEFFTIQGVLHGQGS